MRKKSKQYDVETRTFVAPRNKQQQRLVDSILFNPVTVAIGPAGTGKTLLSIQTLYNLMKSGQLDQIFVIRLISETFGENIGALPGPQPLNSKVLTPTGWRLMGELKIGDEVIAADGTTVKVLNIYPKGTKDIYSIKTLENKETKACLDHLWATKTLEQQKRNKDYSIKTTREIKESLYNNLGKLNHLLPRNNPVQFRPKETLPIPPYTLGAFLGDGCVSRSVSISNPEHEILARVNTELEKIGCKLTKYTDIIHYICSKEPIYNNKPAKSVCLTNLADSSVVTYPSIGLALQDLSIGRSTLHHRCENKVTIDNIQYSFIEDAPKWTNKFKEYLHLLGLEDVKASTKFIPNIYKCSTIADRIALLQGLMDTDGTIKVNGEASFSTTSLQLAKDIIEIVSSLGGRAVLRERDRRGSKSYSGDLIIETKQLSYEFTISLPNEINPFYVSRKAERHKTRLIQSDRIKSIDYIGEQECQCILIDHPEHLYITDDYIVTHNTIDEKLDPFMGPVKDNLLEFLPRGEVEYLIKNQKIEVLPVSFCRGRSFINKGVIIEESQNLTPEMIITISTRIGRNSKLVFNGDIKQADFIDRNGAIYLKELYANLEGSEVIEFFGQDIQRHPMINRILEKAEQLKSKKLASLKLAS